jgi:hypothetical protein
MERTIVDFLPTVPVIDWRVGTELQWAKQGTKEEGMKRKASYRLKVTRREALYVHDEFDHCLMLVEMEGEPIEYQVGVAGEFVSRRSVTFHDRTRGEGEMKGYAITNFRDGSICSRFDGKREGGLTKGTWTIYKGMGKLATIKGSGQFTVKTSDKGEYILDMDGDYEL